MLRIGSVECNEWTSICSKEGITKYPTYRVYPPNPIPAVNLETEEGKTDYTLDTDKLKKLAFKYIGNRVIDITVANHDVFKADNPGWWLFHSGNKWRSGLDRRCRCVRRRN